MQVAALVAWRLKNVEKLERVRAIGYACPPSASPAIAEETEPYALMCVMRYDVIPRISPKTVVALEEELLNISWEQMEVTCGEWGRFGRMLYKRAKCASPSVSLLVPVLRTFCCASKARTHACACT